MKRTLTTLGWFNSKFATFTRIELTDHPLSLTLTLFNKKLKITQIEFDRNDLYRLLYVFDQFNPRKRFDRSHGIWDGIDYCVKTESKNPTFMVCFYKAHIALEAAFYLPYKDTKKLFGYFWNFYYRNTI